MSEFSFAYRKYPSESDESSISAISSYPFLGKQTKRVEKVKPEAKALVQTLQIDQLVRLRRVRGFLPEGLARPVADARQLSAAGVRNADTIEPLVYVFKLKFEPGLYSSMSLDGAPALQSRLQAEAFYEELPLLLPSLDDVAVLLLETKSGQWQRVQRGFTLGTEQGPSFELPFTGRGIAVLQLGFQSFVLEHTLEQLRKNNKKPKFKIGFSELRHHYDRALLSFLPLSITVNTLTFAK